MQSKDLRIGNLVKGNSRGGTHILDIEVLKYIDETKSGYSPIPLTEEMLIDLGFEQCETYRDDELFVIGNFSVQAPKKGYDNSVLWYDEQILSEIKYVHELQNLYFALVGEELELKHESKP